MTLSAASGQEPTIPTYTPELIAARQTHPLPLVAIFQTGDMTLAFAAGKHVFTPDNNRLNSISAAFERAKPALVIVEGFPTAMGDDPPPLVAEVQKRSSVDADPYAKSEATFAASLALDHRIPFIGGEPTDGEKRDGLLKDGYKLSDIMFVYLVRDIEQSDRGGELSGTTDAKLPDVFNQYSSEEARSLGAPQMALPDFTKNYRKVFGVEFEHDSLFGKRADPATTTLVGKLLQAEMTVRDQHIYKTIMRELRTHRRVLIVYGGGHWPTLSGALEHALGKPSFE